MKISLLTSPLFCTLLLCLMVYVWIISCTPAPHLAFKLSPYFADSLPYPAHNPFSADGIALGELLFHETALSGNNEISCATCHSPDLHFTDGFALTNKGLRKKKLSRNTPTLFNLAWANKGLFWDGGAQNLESLVFAPLKHADEMGQDLKLLPQELMQKGNYKTLFFNAFDQDTITNAFIARALAQYMRTLTSSNSKYDAVVQKKAQFSDLEHKGLEIFTQSCISCHPPPFFTDFDFHLVSKFSEAKSIEKMIENEMEKGRFRITADSADIGKFKTPTLRNLALTAPYFHDGHCTTPEMAIREHKVLAQLPNDNEIILLIHFLNTLNEQRVK